MDPGFFGCRGFLLPVALRQNQSMAEYPQPRRPRRRPGENRAALLEAAVFEFGEHGYHGASTAAIAAQADVPQPHVYVHFATKGELFLAALVHAYDSTDRAEREGSPSEVAAAVRAESLIHLQAVAAAGERSLSPRLSEAVSARIHAKGASWHIGAIERAAAALLA